MSGIARLLQPPKGDYDDESHGDTINRKLEQAEALARTMYGGADDPAEGFTGWSAEIQESIHWLLADLIHDARIAWLREAHEQRLEREKRESA